MSDEVKYRVNDQVNVQMDNTASRMRGRVIEVLSDNQYKVTLAVNDTVVTTDQSVMQLVNEEYNLAQSIIQRCYEGLGHGSCHGGGNGMYGGSYNTSTTRDSSGPALTGKSEIVTPNNSKPEFFILFPSAVNAYTYKTLGTNEDKCLVKGTYDEVRRWMDQQKDRNKNWVLLVKLNNGKITHSVINI
jgi:hypothetical protein